jgi:O-antigen/teichoic acid export membrane protein
MTTAEASESILARNSRIITRNTAILVSRYLAMTGMGTVMVLFLPRYLGDEGLGRLQYALSFVSIFAVGIALGTRQFLIKEIARDGSSVRTYLGAAHGLRFVSGLWVLACILLVAHLRGASGETMLVIVLAAFWMVVTSYSQIESAVMQGRENMTWPAMAEMANKLVVMTAGITVLVMGGGIIGYASVLVAGAVINLMLNVGYVHKQYGLNFSLDTSKLRVLFMGGAPFLIITFLSGAYSHTDVIMLNAFTNDAQVGWYAAALQIYRFVEFLPVALTTALLPTLARVHATHLPSLLALAKRALAAGALVMVPISLGLSLLSSEIIAFLPYPEGFRNSAPLITILSLTIPMTALLTVMGTIAMATDRQKYWSIALLATVALNASTNAVAIPYFADAHGNGAIGAALMTLFSEIFMMIIALRFILRELVDRELGGVFVKTLAAGGIMVGACLFARHYGAETGLIVPLGALVYGVIVLATRAVKTSDLRFIWNTLVKRLAGERRSQEQEGRLI